MRGRHVTPVASRLIKVLLAGAGAVAGTIVTSDSGVEAHWIMSWPRCFTVGRPAEENDGNICQPLTAFQHNQGLLLKLQFGANYGARLLSHWPRVCVCLRACVCVHGSDWIMCLPAKWGPVKDCLTCFIFGDGCQNHNHPWECRDTGFNGLSSFFITIFFIK